MLLTKQWEDCQSGTEGYCQGPARGRRRWVGTAASPGPGRLGTCCIPAMELRVVAPRPPPSMPLGPSSVHLDGLRACPHLRAACGLHPCIDGRLPHLKVTASGLQKNGFLFLIKLLVREARAVASLPAAPHLLLPQWAHSRRLTDQCRRQFCMRREPAAPAGLSTALSRQGSAGAVWVAAELPESDSSARRARWKALAARFETGVGLE